MSADTVDTGAGIHIEYMRLKTNHTTFQQIVLLYRIVNVGFFTHLNFFRRFYFNTGLKNNKFRVHTEAHDDGNSIWQ